MNKFILYLKKPYVLILLAIFVIISLYFFLKEEKINFDSEIIQTSTVSEIVSGTGSVSASDEVFLSFETSGMVSRINVKEGDSVSRGALLISLDSALKEADVVNARAAVLVQESKLAEMKRGVTPSAANLAEAKLKSAELVFENARQTLLTSDIQAHFVGNDSVVGGFSFVPPTISGSFMGTEGGNYLLKIYHSGSSSGKSFNFSGLESGTGDVSSVKPQPLGEKGLYVQFPENTAGGTGIEWLVEIPNTRSSSYLQNKRAYDQALFAYEQAKADYILSVDGPTPEQILAQEALVEQAKASLRSSEIGFSKTSLYAPFSGIVQSIPVSVGETLSVGTPVIFLRGVGEQYVTLYVPEVDIANLALGDEADIKFTAFPDETFKATIGFISPFAEIKDGIAVFKTELYFKEPDQKIRAGMSADVDIYSETKEGVIAIPGRAIIRSEGRIFVRVLEAGRVVEKEIKIGLRGFDGKTEILSGLTEGEEVITYIQEEDLKKLSE